MKITEEMVNRFLCWALPKDFAPDGGIAFTPPKNPHHAWPVGTNVLTAIQARAMLEHVVAGAALSDIEQREDAKDAALWRDLELLHPMDLLTMFSGAKTGNVLKEKLAYLIESKRARSER